MKNNINATDGQGLVTTNSKTNIHKTKKTMKKFEIDQKIDIYWSKDSYDEDAEPYDYVSIVDRTSDTITVRSDEFSCYEEEPVVLSIYILDDCECADIITYDMIIRFRSDSTKAYREYI